MFVAGWRHALRSEWPFIIIIIKSLGPAGFLVAPPTVPIREPGRNVYFSSSSSSSSSSSPLLFRGALLFPPSHTHTQASLGVQESEMASAHLTDDQAAVYDRQLRVWGVEVQNRSAAPRHGSLAW